MHDLITKMFMKPNVVLGFSLQNGSLRHHNKIWMGSTPALHEKVFVALHTSTLGGHSGALPCKCIKQLFSWPHMQSDITCLVHSCSICQQAKHDRSKYPGLLQSLLVPSSALEIISMGFVEWMPRSGSTNAILVIVDKFSMFAHFLTMRHPFMASMVAIVFMDQVHCLHWHAKVYYLLQGPRLHK